MAWTAYDSGATIGKTGREGGVIQVDAEYAGAARIMLEAGCLRAPYAITSAIYGYLVHVRFVADDETAQHAIDEMKPALAAIVHLLPGEEDTGEVDLDTIEEAAHRFVQRFP